MTRLFLTVFIFSLTMFLLLSVLLAPKIAVIIVVSLGVGICIAGIGFLSYLLAGELLRE